MKRIAILICLTLIGSLLHAAVGSVVSLAAPLHQTARGAAITSAETLPITAETGVSHLHADTGVSHLHHACADLHKGQISDGGQVPCTLSHDDGSTQCRSTGNDCCHGAMILPAQCDVESPAPVRIANTVALSPPQGCIQQGIYKPPKS